MDKKSNIKIFGYGSLMYGSGINGRYMKRKYTDSDVKPATLSGYKRGPYASWSGVGYYGIVELEDYDVVGAVFDITEEDMIPLNKSEGCNPDGSQLEIGSYTLKDITDDVSYEGKGDERVYTYVITEVIPNEPAVYYFNKVDEKISHLGETFRYDFLTTTHDVYGKIINV